MSGWSVAWITWLVFFLATEGAALFKSNYRGTLTAHLRSWAAMESKPKGWRVRRFALLGLLAWLAAHLLLPPGSF